MSDKYEEKIELVKKTLTLYSREIISNNYNQQHNIFYEWLKGKADIEFWYGYEKIFSKYFKKDMSIDLQDHLWVCCKNITYAISSFIYIKEHSINQYTLDEVLMFLEKFISEQLGFFDNYLNNE